MTLEALALELDRATDALLAEMRRTYPIGARLRVRLQRNHATSTEVEVIGHLRTCGGGKHFGCLRVRILDDWGFETSVPWRAVLA